MKPLFNGWRYAALCSILVGLPVAVACGQPGTGAGEDNQTDGAEIEILFPKMYSAFDGEHDFKLPAKVEGVKKIKWSAEPADLVQLETQDDGSVMITMKGAGDVKITAKAGPLKATAPLTILQATPEDYAIGEDRYNTGTVLFGGRDGGRPDGGWGGGRGDGGGGKGGWDRKIDPKAKCSNCHVKGKKGASVEHTPMQTGGYTDEELITIFTKGTKPDGVPMRIKDEEWYAKNHTWEMEEDEKKGMVVFLRAIEPKEQEPGVDFGGRGKGGGKNRGDGDGKEKPSGESEKPSANDDPK